MGKWGTAFDVLRDVVYGMSENLDLYEQTTLHFIFRRTRMYQKEWEYIPLRHFLEGVSGQRGQIVTPRIRISEKKLLQSLKRLEAKGIIWVERSGTGANKYRINEYDELDTSKIIDESIKQIPIMRDLARQFENGAYRLPPSEREKYKGLSEIPEFQRKRSLKGTAAPTLSMTEPVTPRLGEYNKPILKKPIKGTLRRAATEKHSSALLSAKCLTSRASSQNTEARDTLPVQPRRTFKIKKLGSIAATINRRTLIGDGEPS